MSSPRGLVEGGIGVMVVERFPPVRGDASDDLPRVGDCAEGELSGFGAGRMRLNGQGACMGGVRTLRYILKDRRALLAWGTYLNR